MGDRTFVGDVNGLPKTVGGGAVHADMKYPRFQDWDFHLASELGDVPDANFADWPLTYDELEPFYSEVEQLVGVQGLDGADPFQPKRSRPYPMPPGVPMYVSLLAADGAQKAGYHAFPYPTAINSRPYGGRPPCVDCGFCSGYGCPNNSKGSPAVTFLRDALLTHLRKDTYKLDAQGKLDTASIAEGARPVVEKAVNKDNVIGVAVSMDPPKINAASSAMFARLGCIGVVEDDDKKAAKKKK